MNYSTGTATVERILGVNLGKITIGTTSADVLGTSSIRKFIEDAERYIDAKLSDTVTSLPVSPAPDALRLAADYLSAFFTHSSLYAANKPDEQSPVVNSWKDMADELIEAYKNSYDTGGYTAGWTSQTKLFRERGVEGIDNGLLKDSSDVNKNKRS